MFDITPIQILIVMAVALLVFGPKRLPEMGKSVGRGIREFKNSFAGIADLEPAPPAAPAVAETVAAPRPRAG